ncbi:MAG TPA: SBBP repeat-containing protein, partial [Gemmatimonadales bacterium]|nr:SBBP repeat-containing protein [Gemmatimonadales bacterium]
MLRLISLLALTSLSAHAQSAVFRWVRQIGGSGGQTIAGIGADAAGNIYLAGTTTSLDLPTLGAIQPHPGSAGIIRIDGPGSNYRNLYQSGINSATALALDPSDPGTVYAGSANRIYRSSDAGATWSTLATFDVTRVNGIAVDPAAGPTLYAATSGKGILKSTDGGATWAGANTGIPPAANSLPFASRVWIEPKHPSTLFAAVNGAFQGTLARSTDSGRTWQVLADPSLNPGISSLSFDPFTPGRLYVTGVLGTAYSSDDGLTWSPLDNVGLPNWRPSAILADPVRPGVLYAGAEDALYRSADSGASWTPVIRSRVPLLAADAGSGTVYAFVNGQVVATSDGFSTITPLGARGLPALNDLAAGGGRVFAGTQASTDIFVTRFDPQGNLIYATYFGGASTDIARAMAVDPAGGVYVAGSTQSLDFPATPGAYAKPGPYFLFKLNADGTLAWSTGVDAQPNALAVDRSGHAYVAGITGPGMPATAGSYQPTFQGSFCGPGCLISIPPTNGFLAGFDAAGASLVFATYLGIQNEAASAVAVLADASLVVAGQGVLYHLDRSGSTLIAKRLLSGDIRSLMPEPAGTLLVAGGTAQYPQALAVPTTSNAYQPKLYPVLSLPGTLGNTGSGDAFVARLDSHLDIVASTYLGGEASDVALSAVAGPGGSVIAGGSTYSRAFPAWGPIQSSFATTTGFISGLTPDLSSLNFSTFTGDQRPFYIRSLAMTPDGAILAAGATGAAPAPSPLFGFDALVPDASTQVFLVRVDPLQPPAPRIDGVVNAASQLAVPLSPGETIQVHGDGFGPDAALILN